MNVKRFLWRAVAITALLPTIFSCSKNDGEDVAIKPQFEITPLEIEIDCTAQSGAISVKASGAVEWQVKSITGDGDDWITIDRQTRTGDFELEYSIDEHLLEGARSATIVFEGKCVTVRYEKTIEVTITQTGQEASGTSSRNIQIVNMIDVLPDGNGTIILRPTSGGDDVTAAATVGSTLSYTLIAVEAVGVNLFGEYKMIEILYDGDSDPTPINGRVTFKGGETTSQSERYDPDFKVFGGQEDNPILINTAAKLKILANRVNNQGITYSGIYFLQSADIDLSTQSPWKPIGHTSVTYDDLKTDTPVVAFGGIYDGNNKTITNLNITTGTNIGQGLFGVIKGTADDICVIRNLTVRGSGVDDTNDITVTGGGNGCIVGCLIDYAKIENCVNYANIYGCGGATGAIVGAVGSSLKSTIIQGGSNPLAASVNYAEITKCHNYGRVEVHTTGHNSNGGLVGVLGARSSLTLSSNHGKVKSTGAIRLGGLAGFCIGTIRECYNAGSVESTIQYSSGLVGVIGATANITDCYNTGTITYDDPDVVGTGGIIGFTVPSNNLGYDFRVERCYNTGAMQANAGAILGRIQATTDLSATTHKNLYAIADQGTTKLLGYTVNVPDLTIPAECAAFIPVADAYKKTSYAGFDFTNVWVIDEGTTKPYLKNNPPVTKPQ